MKLIPILEDIQSKVDAAKIGYDREDARLQKEAEKDDSGNEFNICTNGAKWVKKNFFPKAKIMGYHAEDNPGAEIGQDEGGHDFLVLDDRYIIDFWYNNMIDPDAPVFFDMEKDIESVKKYYGDRSTWEMVEK